MDILPAETVLDWTTVARVNALLHRPASIAGGVSTTYLNSNRAQLSALIKGFSMAARKELLRRVVARDSYTERFDVERSGQCDFWVGASPIWIETDVDTDITVYHNTDTPRDFTGSDDKISSDYIICNPKMQREGRIHIEEDLCRCVDCVQIEYTGGMATETVISGGNGSVSSATFTSSGQTFNAKGVAAGDFLAITENGATDHGVHLITAAPTETTLTVPTLTTDVSGLDYEVWGGTDTLVGLYPHLVEAMDHQIADFFENRSRMGIQSEGIAGASFTFYSPRNWLPYVREMFAVEARRI